MSTDRPGDERGRGAEQPAAALKPAPVESEVIGICASAGGPRALASVLERLPADYRIPILVVQHMTPGFIDGLVDWLNRDVALPVGLASDGQALTRGVWLGPDGAHLKLQSGHRLALDSDTVAGKHRPSGDVLLSSLARVAGARAVAVVLTGMGRDGAEGSAAVAASGGRTFAQDEQSSSVYGMPRVAAELGAKTVLTPRAIGDQLAALDRRVARA